MKKKLRLRQWVKDALAIILFYALIVAGVIGLNARFGQLCENGYTNYCPVESAK